MKTLLVIAAILHFAFMLAELVPWPFPLLLRIASKRLPKGEFFTPSQQELVATVVRNAGIYNCILASGFVWAIMLGEAGLPVAQLLFAGALLAGAFGTATLKSPVTAVQALVGLGGLIAGHFTGVPSV